jgi:hypothetical protein
VSGGEPEYYDFIGETENRPIINAPTDFDELVETMYDVAINPEMLIERGQRSREFVEKHNAAPIVAKRYLDFWTSKL